MAWLMAHKEIILGFLFLLSEAIGLIPQVKASGVFEAIFNGIKGLMKLVGVEPPKVE